MLQLNYDYINNILPQVDKRTPIRLDWMYLSITPLIGLYTRLVDLNAEYKFDALHNSQILSLEDYINSVLSPLLPITIEEGVFVDPTYIFRRNETFGKPKYMFIRSETINESQKTYIYQRNELLENNYDYNVIVQIIDAGLETQIEAILRKYNPAGKIYKITIE